jgi:hypothetical protein
MNTRRSSLLLFGWLLLATPAAVHAQFTYIITNGTITITGYTGPGGDVTIPSTIGLVRLGSPTPQASPRKEYT